jgi:hypothetical protein
MTEVLEKINALIDAPTDDLRAIEHILTDGYAHALSLEAEQWRIERKISLAAGEIDGGNTAAKVQELGALARQLDGTAADLVTLRARLADLRRVANDARVAATR